ncbi:MAG: hypothetical protein LAP13_20295, partial [Acidobacteriia bacterium]|nr:hypothetical protein [Terriglobia bacterium]
SLIHTNWAAEFFLYAGLVVTAGQDHEAPLLYRLVEAFVEHHGRGVMKRLILDRGFLEGAEIGRCKKDYGIDVLIPVRKDMDVYQDALGLMRGNRMRFESYTHPAAKPPLDPKPLHVPAEILRREKKRQEKLDIAHWFHVWLETPDLFFDWLELRKASEDFRKLFGAGDGAEE